MHFFQTLTIVLLVLFVAEQLAIKFFLPYPYRSGFIVYRTSIDVPTVNDLKSIESGNFDFTGSINRFTSPLRFNYCGMTEAYFYRLYVRANVFEPIIFSGQVQTKNDGTSELIVRVGYCALVLFVIALINIIMTTNVLVCAGAMLLSALTMSSFYSSFVSYCSVMKAKRESENG